MRETPGGGGEGRADRWRAALAPLLADPRGTAVLSDFDGSLATIVDDPRSVRPHPGATDALAALARSFGRVAVVSGRPVSFLADRLGGVGGVLLVGLYGLEWVGEDGAVVTLPAAEAWRPVVAGAVDRLAAAAPMGVGVEAKGLTVTVHWRRAPDGARWAGAAVAAEAGRTGLEPHPGRMSVELRPPLPVDKGTATADLVRGFGAACFVGDDLGDLPAFVALDDAAKGGMAVVKVAVTDTESPAAVAGAADLSVDGPAEAVELLRWLGDRAAAA